MSKVVKSFICRDCLNPELVQVALVWILGPVQSWSYWIRFVTIRPIGDLWRRAFDCGHGVATTRRPSLAMRRRRWWWWWHKNCNLIFIIRSSRNIFIKSVSIYLAVLKNVQLLLGHPVLTVNTWSKPSLTAVKNRTPCFCVLCASVCTGCAQTLIMGCCIWWTFWTLCLIY